MRKTERADLRKQYPIYAQLGIIAALLVLILAFRVDVQRDADFVIVLEDQNRIQIDEIVQTQREFTPPPPPRPPAPRVVPDDTIIEDEPLNWDATLSFDDDLIARRPPPPVEEDFGDEIFVVVEQQPELIGGLAALQRVVEYPDFARRAGIQGTVFVQFVVDESGKVVDPQVLRGVHRLLDDAAVEAITQMQFEPGKQRGQEVRVRMSLPVRFQLA